MTAADTAAWYATLASKTTPELVSTAARVTVGLRNAVAKGMDDLAVQYADELAYIDKLIASRGLAAG